MADVVILGSNAFLDAVDRLFWNGEISLRDWQECHKRNEGLPPQVKKNVMFIKGDE